MSCCRRRKTSKRCGDIRDTPNPCRRAFGVSQQSRAHLAARPSPWLGGSFSFRILCSSTRGVPSRCVRGDLAWRGSIFIFVLEVFLSPKSQSDAVHVLGSISTAGLRFAVAKGLKCFFTLVPVLCMSACLSGFQS